MSDSNRVGDDLRWGVDEIGAEFLNEPDAKKRRRRAYYMLENGYIDADKCGNIWVASCQRNRARFCDPRPPRGGPPEQQSDLAPPRRGRPKSRE